MIDLFIFSIGRGIVGEILGEKCVELGESTPELLYSQMVLDFELCG